MKHYVEVVVRKVVELEAADQKQAELIVRRDFIPSQLRTWHTSIGGVPVLWTGTTARLASDREGDAP